MKYRWLLKIMLLIIAILGFVVVGIMYTKLSFIDWPYLIGGILFLAFGVFFPVQGENNLNKK
ncbi:MAG: hypothetical protein CBD76_03770 [Pelagibacteraceae bacterium TMED216]|nr:MAG: hypothetical protein CBD76_03770 [Pelagibacteraceae bacterium TMED216]|tara:strand:- start:668 stop:853 length:186 start_codon:yes stop_codon:yes gene_type:complete